MKKKPKDNRKAVYTGIAHIVSVEGKKKLALNSPEMWQHQVNKLWEGKKYAVTIEEYKATRSGQQLRYYWAITGLLADHTGYTSEELHDAVMRRKFGTKTVKIADLEEQVRQSISDTARFPKGDMVELITEVLELCVKMEVKVPTMEELGFISNT